MIAAFLVRRDHFRLRTNGDQKMLLALHLEVLKQSSVFQRLRGQSRQRHIARPSLGQLAREPMINPAKDRSRRSLCTNGGSALSARKRPWKFSSRCSVFLRPKDRNVPANCAHSYGTTREDKFVCTECEDRKCVLRLRYPSSRGWQSIAGQTRRDSFEEKTVASALVHGRIARFP